MSYQVLARKWRPQNFHELMGQEHVKQALVNALNEQRLHHAYLFTGTRGVGKTTIARIFAKSLNCEQGVTSTPCGQCSACSEIEAGKFIDLIEIDAASRTKVEDTREILDNVQYAPTRGRYKVYLIDEVHMLSKHSFNALLKTLEEPPEHVKFLLATTDPQKLPVTILSRCLQFNLNAMAQGQIVAQLEKILPQEGVNFESTALETLAKAADGSMRDALSLTDQAIAQTNGDLQLHAVQSMLGLMDNAHAVVLLSAVLCQDGEALMNGVDKIAMQNGNFVSVLDDLVTLLHAIQMTQLVGQTAKLSSFDANDIRLFAEQLSPAKGQMLYQLLLNGKKDLQWAPEPRLGFEMVMLRLMAFERVDDTSSTSNTQVSQNKPDDNKVGNLRSLLKKAPQAVADQQPNATASSVVPVVEETPQRPPQAIQPTNTAPQVEPLTEPLPSEDDLSYQYDEVMAQAVEQGFQSNHDFQPPPAGFADVTHHQAASPEAGHEQPLEQAPQASMQPGEAAQVTAKQQQTNSAIARILQNRNISGAGKLVGGEEDSKKSEAQAAPAQQPTPPASESTAPENKVTSLPRQREKKPDFKARHKTVEANLAPELIEQLSPVQSETEQEQPVIIPAPSDFVSPISELKLAHQVDDWAKMIEDMELGGRIRQFALHSTIEQQQDQCILHVDMSQQHLDSPMLRDKLQQSLSELLSKSVALQLNFVEQVNGTPFQVQQQLDEKRLQQAKQALNDDPLVGAFVQSFDASLDENTVQAL
ncbi:DNA polymerase III subunit gamma/tau [Pseudoalteromonas sp. T1lg65]|uniref:DNA polymerase III subunit gamma/tau n=1 Tax=Pseudoalteromonas sp. T1lg65 TaxID=2077101 RepID=UPI003F7B13AE